MRIGIVGCSISGAYLAYRLAKAGHDVTVFEVKKKIGGKACSGLVSERLWDFVPKNEKLVENKIRFVDIRFPKKNVELSFKPDMLVIDRNRLDNYVADLAERAGAKIKTGHRAVKIISLKKSRPHLVVESGGKTSAYEFDRIIGCDGANSCIREQLGLGRPKFRLGIYTFVKNKKGKKRKDRVKVIPTNLGFKWKIPRKRTMEVGAIEKPKEAKKAFGQVARGKKKKIFSAIVPEGLITSDKKHFALCGDAAGLTKPWSGGGVIWGMTAADMLVKNNCDVPRYNRMLERHFGPKIIFSKIMRRAVFLTGRKTPWLLPKSAVMDSDWLY